jgi:hypothetical protein
MADRKSGSYPSTRPQPSVSPCLASAVNPKDLSREERYARLDLPTLEAKHIRNQRKTNADACAVASATAAIAVSGGISGPAHIPVAYYYQYRAVKGMTRTDASAAELRKRGVALPSPSVKQTFQDLGRGASNGATGGVVGALFSTFQNVFK